MNVSHIHLDDGVKLLAVYAAHNHVVCHLVHVESQVLIGWLRGRLLVGGRGLSRLETNGFESTALSSR